MQKVRCTYHKTTVYSKRIETTSESGASAIELRLENSTSDGPWATLPSDTCNTARPIIAILSVCERKRRDTDTHLSEESDTDLMYIYAKLGRIPEGGSEDERNGTLTKRGDRQRIHLG